MSGIFVSGTLRKRERADRVKGNVLHFARVTWFIQPHEGTTCNDRTV